MSSPVLQHEAKLIPIDSIKPYRGNPRIGDIPAIRESLRTNGQYRPVVVRIKTREVLAGNHTWIGAKEEGWTEIWATFIDCDAQAAKRIVAVDNGAARLGGFDNEALVALLGSLPDLSGTSYQQKDLDKMAAGLIMGVGGDTEPKPLPPKPKTKPGDLYLLGDHRLLCGDCTDLDTVKRLVGRNRLDCMWTDPPFGTGAKDMFPGNAVEDLEQLLLGAFGVADRILTDGAALYVLQPGNATSVVFGAAFLAYGWRLKQTLVWLKESPAFGWHDYHYEHELLLYGFTAGKGYRGRTGGVGWHGGENESSVLRFNRPTGKTMGLHPVAKSVGLVEQCLINSTPRGGKVYEPFCGSGTALIACDNLRRQCFALEIDPGFCDVIVDRWERHTGDTAEVQHANRRQSPT